MNELEELKKIKKKYGENFMKLCRDLFPTLLEQEWKLYEILSSSFSESSKSLYEDIIKHDLKESFKSYIYSKVDLEDREEKTIEEKTPYELLEEAGYDLYECLSEEEIQEFKKYYKHGEELCTFVDRRLDRCVVFFAVKKNVENIKREEFKNPKREDEYGTSVMGIQFNRQGMCTVSIKNRYNHIVNNPDATYGNNLDNIIPGLTQSFAILLQEKYGLELNSPNIGRFHIPGYVLANDGKYYKYNMEINGDYYCPGNIIIKRGGEVTSIAKPEEGLLIDYFFIDKKNKRIEVCPDIEDSFVDDLQEIYLQDVEEPVIIGIDKNNQIVKYNNETIINVGSNFLCFNKELSQLDLPNLTQVGDNFLNNNQGLTRLDLPNLIQVGDNFLEYNEILMQLDLPNLTQVGDSFLESNEELTRLELPNLTQLGLYFLNNNRGLVQLKLPRLIQIGNGFLNNNKSLTMLELPNLEQVGAYFLNNNQDLTSLDLPNLTQVGDGFLNNNQNLTQLKLPSLIQVGAYFLNNNIGLTRLDLPNLTRVGNSFLYKNQKLSQLDLPNLTQVGNNFLNNNQSLTRIDLPSLIQVGNSFLESNEKLTELELLNLTQVGNSFLESNERLIKLELPNLAQIGNSFLMYNKGLTSLELPNLTQVGNSFLVRNEGLIELKLPNLIRVGNNFLYKNQELRQLELPNLTQIGNSFLEYNERLPQLLDLPNLSEEVKEKFIDGNIKEKEKQESGKKEQITSQTIAQLDKDTELTTSEVNIVGKIISKIKRGLLKKEK